MSIKPLTKESFKAFLKDVEDDFKSRPVQKMQIPGVVLVCKKEDGSYYYSDDDFAWFFSNKNKDTALFPMGSGLYKLIHDRAKEIGVQI